MSIQPDLFKLFGSKTAILAYAAIAFVATNAYSGRGLYDSLQDNGTRIAKQEVVTEKLTQITGDLARTSAVQQQINLSQKQLNDSMDERIRRLEDRDRGKG